MPNPSHEIRIARPEDVAGMATCHADAFPGRGTSSMGDGWLRFLYQFYLDADMNVSMVAVGSNGEIEGIAVGGDKKLFGQYRKASARRFPLRLAWRTIVDPAVRRPVLNLLKGIMTRRNAAIRFRRRPRIPEWRACFRSAFAHGPAGPGSPANSSEASNASAWNSVFPPPS